MNENLPEEISFGDWLHRQRRLLDLTQQQLADQVGCAHITLRRIESGTLKPSRAMALILLEKLGVPQSEREAWLPFTRGLSGFPKQPVDSGEAKPTNNLPTSLTSFVGRQKEQQELTNFLVRSHLVTLLGPGGIGKSRLALQVARKMLDQYPDGVWFVDLAPILDPLLVPRATAIALGLRDEPQQPVIDMLCAYLHRRNMLLILDNCEHLIESVASMAEKLLSAAPNLRILTSSREALAIEGETIYPVHSLELPDIQHLPPIESLVRYKAVELFMDRANSAEPSFTITEEHASPVALICHRLDGIPLAIELAAAKIRVLSVEQIAERLDDRFKLLTGGSRSTLERHRTLRAAIDWSYNLLSPAEQICFQRISVFVGGWTLDAAEPICEDESTSSGEHSDKVLNLMEQLINKSLITMEAVQHQSRYRMLETLRQYASEKLAESGESDVVQDRHLYYFLNLAETAAPHLIRPEQVEWLNRLEGEQGNLRAALVRSLAKERPEYALRLTAALENFWFMRSNWKEGARWLERALAMPMDNPTPFENASRARALYRDAALADAMDDVERLQSSAQASLQLCEQGIDRQDLAIARFYKGQAVLRTGDLNHGEQLLELCLSDFQELKDPYWEANTRAYFFEHEIMQGKESYAKIMARNLEMARKTGERLLLSSVLHDAAGIAWVRDDLQQAQAYLEEADRLSAEIGLTVGYIFNPDLHACIAHSRRDYPQARKLYLQSIQKFDLVGEKNVKAKTIQYLGILERDDGHLQLAQVYFENALDSKRKVGQQYEVSISLALLGQIMYLQGDLVAAREYFKESLLIAKTASRPYYVLVLVSTIFAKRAPQSAARILAVIQGFFADKSNPPLFPLAKLDFENAISQTRLQLGDVAFEVAWAEGEKLSLNEVLDLAIKTLEKI